MASTKTAAAKTPRARKSAKKDEPLTIGENSATVEFAESRSYSVHFTRGAFSPENPLLSQILPLAGAKTRVFAVVDFNVARQTPGLPARMAAAIESAGGVPAGKPVVAAGGEQSKTDGGRTAWAVANTLLEAGITADDVIFAIGGGAVLDVAGFAASMLNGGTKIIRFPTTLLAQCAAGVSCSCGVGTQTRKDAFSAKSVPFAVVDDFDFLATLTPENFRNGIPEAISAAATRDRALLEWIADSAEKLAARDSATAEELVRRAAAARLGAIARGEACGYGRWAAARLQELTRWRLWHGYALAMGMCIDSAYAVQKGWLPEEEGDLAGTALFKTGGLYGLERFGALLDSPERLVEGIDAYRARNPGPLPYPGPDGTTVLDNAPDRDLYARIIAELAATRRELAKNKPRETPAAAEPEDDGANAAPAEPPPDATDE